ncbi:MAG: PhoH family protein [Phycisphaerales bacterium]|jgi:phosphate starvation-inducible protein PhoH and related proteins|nr:PhoH family protein [Phycisphaerales bacterium]
MAVARFGGEITVELSIKLETPHKAAMLFGPADKHLKLIRDSLSVQLVARAGIIKISGSPKRVSLAATVIDTLQRAIRRNKPVGVTTVTEAIAKAASDAPGSSEGDILDVYVSGKPVRPKTPGQHRYVEAMNKCDLVFCTGPAGTGKTYLAVAIAVHMLKTEQAKRLILVRPAVEAGEKLGFLPGDMQAKVNPYLRPLLDALNDMMTFDQVRRFMDNDVIEIIPLAFMRGRTLNDSVIILDEAQNATATQMLMFLTRMGHGSKMIVTGDGSQTDLPDGSLSGLVDAKRRLSGIKGLDFVTLDRLDIVRHHLVQNIVDAYGRDDK